MGNTVLVQWPNTNFDLNPQIWDSKCFFLHFLAYIILQIKNLHDVNLAPLSILRNSRWPPNMDIIISFDLELLEWWFWCLIVCFPNHRIHFFVSYNNKMFSNISNPRWLPRWLPKWLRSIDIVITFDLEWLEWWF